MAVHTDYEDAPKVKLGGKEWPVPLLSARQNMIIDPLILQLTPLFSEIQKDSQFGFTKVTTQYYKDFQEICFAAIKKASPNLSRDEFLDMPITLAEMVTAFPVIAKQTGIFAGEKETTSKGEAKEIEAPLIGNV